MKLNKLYLSILFIALTSSISLWSMEESIFAPNGTLLDMKEPIAQEQQVEATETQKLLNILGIKEPRDLKFYAALPILKQYSTEEINKLAIPEEVKEYALSLKPEISKELTRKALVGDLAAVKTLLSFGPDLNTQGDSGMTALLHAIWNYNSEPHKAIADLLIEKGADVNAQDNTTGDTALILASINGWTDLVKTLLEHRADPNHKAKDGFTALRLAKNYKLQDVVNLLAQYGAHETSQEE